MTIITNTWNLNDARGRPVDVIAGNGLVFVCDAPGSPHHIASLRLTGDQAQDLAAALIYAIDALRGRGDARRWRLEDATGRRFRVTVNSGVIRISPATVGAVSIDTTPRIVVGGEPEALPWVRTLMKAAHRLSIDADA
jgi:hypothetical protein